MLNVIPATPQEVEEFPGAWAGPRRRRLGGAEEDDALEEDPDMSYSASTYSLPQADSLRSMARHAAALHDELEESVPFEVPTTQLPTPPVRQTPPEPAHSPPFQSYPSLPSLTSHSASNSITSIPTSESDVSLASMDVEAELGSMLASLSTDDLSYQAEVRPDVQNPGLGLGLDLSSTSVITSPLAPKRRPPPLDLSLSRSAPPAASSAPAGPARHRTAFYKSARAYPNSPSSGIFTASSTSLSSQSSVISEEHMRRFTETTVRDEHRHRDSISVGSEASDEELHTASIVLVKSFVLEGKTGMEVLGDDVGVAI